MNVSLPSHQPPRIAGIGVASTFSFRRSPPRISPGGNTGATGKGGDRVWRDALDPAEQRTLKRFFD